MIKLIANSNYTKNFIQVFKWVLGVHIIIGLIALLGLPKFSFKKTPDITIELSVLAPSSGGDKNSTSQQQAIEKKRVEKVLPKDEEGTQVKDLTQVSQAGSISSSSGPAAALTSDADYKASYLNNPKPPYPPLAVKMRIEGKVGIIVEVLPNGKAGRVTIESSSGQDMLDQSALQAVKQWQFIPAKKDGVVVPQVVRIPINFNLKNR
ncbi:energy transducer TonB [Polynucleobacter sp. 30F-ANTBAC]|jgi:protein TonB|uniref:energy transducer TonB n=1 Tax=Polynucleobacter sp. 30F-ANTBAC TaxID=2689095 RepID=UPI001C0BC281|nr:energy transducer TonB [Polynucleobacter sp. 30F-ANTBAC]MBU3599088.1 energy transducer TonB [Polynucleobacter sp. 30F-ANTBAC]